VTTTEPRIGRCREVTVYGEQCFRFAQAGREYCFQHPLAERRARRTAELANGHAPEDPVPPPVAVPAVVEPPAPAPAPPSPGCVDCGAPLPPARCRPCATKVRDRQLEVLRDAHLAGGKWLATIHLAAALTPETCPFCRSKAQRGQP
jgi:hypothetical protein